jgi:hypothetical protein
MHKVGYHAIGVRAIQIAAALTADREAFLTNDAALKRVEELRILILNDLEIPA